MEPGVCRRERVDDVPSGDGMRKHPTDDYAYAFEPRYGRPATTTADESPANLHSCPSEPFLSVIPGSGS